MHDASNSAQFAVTDGLRPTQTKIDLLIAEYMAAHPDFMYPESGDRHASILAIGSQIKPWLFQSLGGAAQYWRAMLGSAEDWFAHPGAESSREYRLFCYFFEADVNSYGEGREETKALTKTYTQWRRSKNPRFAPANIPSSGIKN